MGMPRACFGRKAYYNGIGYEYWIFHVLSSEEKLHGNSNPFHTPASPHNVAGVLREEKLCLTNRLQNRSLIQGVLHSLVHSFLFN